MESLPHSNVSPTYLNFPGLPDPNTNYIFQSIIYNQVKDVMNSLRNSTTSYFYGFSVDILKSVKDIILILFTNVFGIYFNYVHDNLKLARVLPLTQNDSSNINNYRSIILLPFLPKSSKRLILTCHYFFEDSKM